jgi:hypothetical protein
MRKIPRKQSSSQRKKRLKKAQVAYKDRLQDYKAEGGFGDKFPEAATLYDMLSDNYDGFVIITAARESAAETLRPFLLTELANLSNEGLASFQKYLSKHFILVPDGQVLQLRDELREIWRHQLMKAEQTISGWLTWKPTPGQFQSGDYSPFFPSLEFGSILLDTRNFHAQLAQAVLERNKYMKICGNPECTNPYFLARRSDQRYCEQGSCTDYGHRRAALDYWHRNKPYKKTESPKGEKRGSQRSTKKR